MMWGRVKGMDMVQDILHAMKDETGTARGLSFSLKGGCLQEKVVG